MIPRIKRILDLSQPLYHNAPGAPIFSLPQVERTHIAARDGFNLERLTCVTHNGTHIDAPYHFLENGTTIDAIDPVNFQGMGMTVDLMAKKPQEGITVDDLKEYDALINEDHIVLLCTGWGYKRGFSKEYLNLSPTLTEDAANYLVKKKIRGVGIDHFSLGGISTHLKILGAGIWILEDLYLPKTLLDRREWHVIALPLLLRGASGAPARVIAVEYEDCV